MFVDVSERVRREAMFTMWQRLKNRDEQALQQIIHTYGSYVKAIMYAILKRDDLVQLCMNDVFWSVWQKSDQFKGEEVDFKKWIGTIAKYKAIDLYRQEQKRNAHQSDDEIMPSIHSTEQTYMNKVDRETLLFEISQLAPPNGDIFIMKYYLQLSNQQIADACHMTKAAVDHRLLRSKKKLAKNKRLKEMLQ